MYFFGRPLSESHCLPNDSLMVRASRFLVRCRIASFARPTSSLFSLAVTKANMKSRRCPVTLTCRSVVSVSAFPLVVAERSAPIPKPPIAECRHQHRQQEFYSATRFNALLLHNTQLLVQPDDGEPGAMLADFALPGASVVLLSTEITTGAS
jgi:hypothetical protein